MKKTVKLKISSSGLAYDILVTNEPLFSSLIRKINSIDYSNLIIVTNEVVLQLYNTVIKTAFQKQGLSYHIISLPDGEKYKSLTTVQNIYGKLLSYGADRGSILIGIGGGVIGDITGFVASTYMRGIRYIQVPTTLLAQVDAAIGGKTGVDFNLIKNVIGSFYQPIYVYSNTNFLTTLPDRIYKAGLAEVIKYGIIKDKELFFFIEKNKTDILQRSQNHVVKIVYNSSDAKSWFVRRDEKETTGIRMILNFGHTFAHAIETLTNYRVLHGEAVGIGMIIAAEVSYILNLCSKQIPERIREVVMSMGLPHSLKGFAAQSLSKAIKYDKKSKANTINLILVKDIGIPKVFALDKKVLKKILREVQI